MTSIQIENTIYASDPITGWAHYMKSQTILHKVIENGDIRSAIYYGSQPDLIDAETCLEITPLFMMLQYSIVADFGEAIKVLVDKKLQVNPSFERFFKNIILAKKYGDVYVERLLNKLNKSIGDEKYKQITKDINY